MIAFVGIMLLATLLAYSTHNVETVFVPDRGGVFREGVAGSPKYFNPLLCHVNDVDLDLCNLLYRGLTKIDSHGRVAPDLAAGWTIADDVTYTFRLLPNQYWHDGQPITADDVLFTIGVLQDPEVYNLPDVASLWRSVSVEKVDDLTIRFSLSEPFPPFLEYTSIGLLPKHVWDGTPAAELATMPLTESPIGSGPLQVAELMPDHVRLEPNPFSSSTPFLSALELYFYPDHPSLFAAYAAGEIDGISYIGPQDMPAAAARDDLKLFSSVQPGHVAIVLNLQNPDVAFFQDKAVRQALYYGLDRERMIEEAVAGQGILAHSVLLPDHWAYNPNVHHYGYDPQKARQLLDQAGWIDTDGDGIRDKDGQSMEFVLYGNDDLTRQALAEQIALGWQELGIGVKLATVTYAGLVGDFLAPRRFDAALVAWEGGGDPDPYPLWHSTQAEGGGQNYGGWQHAEADEVMEQARTLVSESDRQQLYARFQQIFTEEAPALLLYHPVYTYGVSDRVHDVQIGFLHEPSDRFATFADWYILTRRVPANQLPSDLPAEPPKSVGE